MVTRSMTLQTNRRENNDAASNSGVSHPPGHLKEDKTTDRLTRNSDESPSKITEKVSALEQGTNSGGLGGKKTRGGGTRATQRGLGKRASSKAAEPAGVEESNLDPEFKGGGETQVDSKAGFSPSETPAEALRKRRRDPSASSVAPAAVADTELSSSKPLDSRRCDREEEPEEDPAFGSKKPQRAAKVAASRALSVAAEKAARDSRMEEEMDHDEAGHKANQAATTTPHTRSKKGNGGRSGSGRKRGSSAAIKKEEDEDEEEGETEEMEETEEDEDDEDEEDEEEDVKPRRGRCRALPSTSTPSKGNGKKGAAKKAATPVKAKATVGMKTTANATGEGTPEGDKSSEKASSVVAKAPVTNDKRNGKRNGKAPSANGKKLKRESDDKEEEEEEENEDGNSNNNDNNNNTKRKRKTKKGDGDDSADSDYDVEAPPPTATALPPPSSSRSKPRVKPTMRPVLEIQTSKRIKEIVRQQAAVGVFEELVALHTLFPHSRSYDGIIGEIIREGKAEEDGVGSEAERGHEGEGNVSSFNCDGAGGAKKKSKSEKEGSRKEEEEEKDLLEQSAKAVAPYLTAAAVNMKPDAALAALAVADQSPFSIPEAEERKEEADEKPIVVSGPGEGNPTVDEGDRCTTAVDRGEGSNGQRKRRREVDEKANEKNGAKSNDNGDDDDDNGDDEDEDDNEDEDGGVSPGSSSSASAASPLTTGKKEAEAAAKKAQLNGDLTKPKKPKKATAPPPLDPPISERPTPLVVPNLGYACLNVMLRRHDIFTNRTTIKAGFAKGGLALVSRLALQNVSDLEILIRWNEAHGIRFFRMSSCFFPWMSHYQLKELPDYDAIKAALAAAGATARQLGHRLTFHPSEFTKIAGDRPDVVDTSVHELEIHSEILDLMGFLPASHVNKINIHVGGVYGDKRAAMDRFARVVSERLSPHCRARLTVENDDRASMFSVRDLLYLYDKIRIPIVFDFHHYRFCPGDMSEREAFEAAIATWPAGVRPVVHWSESQEGKRPNAHSDYITGPVALYGRERDVDVMIESKAKEMALLLYREAAVWGSAAERPSVDDPLAKMAEGAGGE